MSEYEYINITETHDTGKTKRWDIRSKSFDDMLGSIFWYGNWRQYIFNPEPGTIYSAGCLDDIRSFIANEMETRKVAAGKEKE